jgi:hypothetical protein
MDRVRIHRDTADAFLDVTVGRCHFSCSSGDSSLYRNDKCMDEVSGSDVLVLAAVEKRRSIFRHRCCGGCASRRWGRIVGNG